MHLDAGKLNRRIVVLAETKVPDSEGYGPKKPSVVWRCWAQFSRSSGKEMAQSNADYTEISVRFLIRTPPVDISRKMVIIYAGRRYEITYVNDYGDDGKYTEVHAKLETLEG